MGIAHVHTDLYNDIAATLNPQSITKPTGFTTGEIGILVICNEFGAVTTQSSSLSAGWTQIGTTQLVTNGTEHAQLSAFWANGSVGVVTITNTQTGSNYQQGTAFSCFSGVDLVTPIDFTPVASNSSASATLSVTGGTTVTDQCWDCFAAGEWLGTAALTATSFTISENAHGQAATAMCYNTTPKGIGGTGVVTLNGTAGGTEVIVAIRFALRPATAADVLMAQCWT